MTPVVVALATFALGLLGPAIVLPALKWRGAVDVASERSSHRGVAIRGVGLATAVAVSVGLTIACIASAPSTTTDRLVVIGACALAFAALGFIDDLWGIGVGVRGGAQLVLGVAAAAAIVVTTGAPFWLVPLFALGIAAYVNGANFMDGLDGLSGLHGVVVGAAFVIAGHLAAQPWLLLAGVVLAGAFAGFLPWNLLRGGTFLGDVGSYLLGASIAGTVALAVAAGVPPVAVIAPTAVYLLDVGTTLAVRVARRERWYQAHRSHIYQRLATPGTPHLAVSGLVAGITAVCAAAGLAIAYGPPPLQVIAAVLALLALAAYAAAPAIAARTGRMSVTRD